MNLVNRIYPHVPRPIRRLLKKPYFLLVDAGQSVKSYRRRVAERCEVRLRRRVELVPPPKLRELSGPRNYDDYVSNGEWHFQRLMKDLLGVEPHHAILDVGCGPGQKARPLTKYLRHGRYEGFDIIPESVKWAQNNITPRYPNFRFQLADIYSEYYHPEGRYQASEWKFPYPDESFDFVVLFSVFTHILPPGLDNYLSEIARVLKRGGKCATTYFLVNQSTLKAIVRGWNLNRFPYVHDDAGYRLADESFPEAAVAYREDFIKNVYEKYGLRIEEPVLYGTWRWKEAHDQDYIIASKI